MCVCVWGGGASRLWQRENGHAVLGVVGQVLVQVGQADKRCGPGANCQRRPAAIQAAAEGGQGLKV